MTVAVAVLVVGHVSVLAAAFVLALNRQGYINDGEATGRSEMLHDVLGHLRSMDIDVPEKMINA